MNNLQEHRPDGAAREAWQQAALHVRGTRWYDAHLSNTARGTGGKSGAASKADSSSESYTSAHFETSRSAVLANVAWTHWSTMRPSVQDLE